MTSDPQSAFAWMWLPGELEPVVCGRLVDDGNAIAFAYARSYLDRSDAVPIYEHELPLESGAQSAADGWRLPLCIDDSMPDAWGRRVVAHRLGESTSEFGEFTYLLNSGSDRVGALDFQTSSVRYVARDVVHPSLDDLADAARRMQTGEPLGPELDAALAQGSSLGGARPKALLVDGRRRLIAKFESVNDTYPVVQGEFVAMDLARRCGLNVAAVELVRAGGRHALLVERFDREPSGARRRLVSALTILKLTTFPGGRYGTYIGLADAIRKLFADSDASLVELFGRISFNILCGNTDDHGRNHAAFVGDDLALTPAYDICPQARGTEANQAMAFTRGPDGQMGVRASRVRLLIAAAADYHLTGSEAQTLVDAQRATIRSAWDEVCDAAELTISQREAFMGTQFLNNYAFT